MWKYTQSQHLASAAQLDHLHDPHRQLATWATRHTAPLPPVGVSGYVPPRAPDKPQNPVAHQRIDRLARQVLVIARRPRARLPDAPKLYQACAVLAQHAHPAPLLAGRLIALLAPRKDAPAAKRLHPAIRLNMSEISHLPVFGNTYGVNWPFGLRYAPRSR